MAKPKLVTKTALRRLMKVEGDAKIVSIGAIEELQEFLNEKAINITKKALVLAKHANRKTISKEDIKLCM